MALRTYYEILGVSHDAVEGEIRRGYRRAVQEHHPDHNPSGAKSQKRIRELNAARETLLNSELREKYDAKLRRGGLIPPENSADPDPAKAKDQADSDELDFPESDGFSDAESVADGFASQSFEPELESTTAAWNTSSSKNNRHKYSGKKRKQRFQLLVTLVMIPAGGIAGIAVAVLLLWVGFRLDPLGLIQVDGTPVASKSVDPIPSTNPLSRGSSAANTFGGPLNLNQSKPRAPKKKEVASPKDGNVLGDPLNLNQTAPVSDGRPPTEEEMQNFLNSLDKKTKKTSSGTQGSDSPTIEPNPKEPTAPVKTVNFSLLDRFAALPKLPRGWKIEESRSVTIDKYGQGATVELPVPELANTTTYSVTVDLQLDGRITGRPRFHIFLPTGNGGQVLLDFEFIKTMWSFRVYSRTPEKSTLEGVRSYRPAFGTRQIKMQIAPDETRVWLGAEIVALFKTPSPASSPSNAKPTVSLDCIPGSVMKFRVRRFDIELEQNVNQTGSGQPALESRHDQSTELETVNAIGMSFAKLEFPEPPQFGKLASGTAIHSDRDSVWAKMPVELVGLQVTQWKVHQGLADVSVTTPGYVIMATSPRWGGGGEKDGIWEKELTTEKYLLDDGWVRYTSIEEVTDDPENPSLWPVFVKQFEKGEKLKIRTEKYLAPRFFLPPNLSTKLRPKVGVFDLLESLKQEPSLIPNQWQNLPDGFRANVKANHVTLSIPAPQLVNQGSYTLIYNLANVGRRTGKPRMRVNVPYTDQNDIVIHYYYGGY
ncbi:J domain-containing protein [bacterium]|nr:J domain-containing protein [bacterium]